MTHADLHPANDLHRPRFHVLPAQGWMNDPNGLIQWQGRYHLFYQYNPYGALHGNIHWGHAHSADLLSWEHLPIALTPTPGGADADGCWSGCAVDHDGTPTLLYTGVFPEVQMLATTRDHDLLTWQKHDTPVIAAPPAHLTTNGFRDPCVWREGDHWYLMIGSGIQGLGGTVLLYRSVDLHTWEYLGTPFTDPNGTADGMWECPAFFPLPHSSGDKYVLILSVLPGAYTDYFVGTYSDFRFTPEYAARLDHGRAFYAPQTFLDAQGRRLMFGWLRETRSDRELVEAGWAGAMSLPLEVSLNPDLSLRVEPVAEMTRLRGASPDPASMTARAWEILIEADVTDDLDLWVACSPDDAEYTRITYDQQALSIDRTMSSLNPNTDHRVESAPLPLQPDETLQVRVFYDHSTLEVFANGRVMLCTRIYPTRADSVGIRLHSTAKLDLWELSR